MSVCYFIQKLYVRMEDIVSINNLYHRVQNEEQIDKSAY